MDWNVKGSWNMSEAFMEVLDPLLIFDSIIAHNGPPSQFLWPLLIYSRFEIDYSQHLLFSNALSRPSTYVLWHFPLKRQQKLQIWRGKTLYYSLRVSKRRFEMKWYSIMYGHDIWVDGVLCAQLLEHFEIWSRFIGSDGFRKGCDLVPCRSICSEFGKRQRLLPDVSGSCPSTGSQHSRERLDFNLFHSLISIDRRHWIASADHFGWKYTYFWRTVFGYGVFSTNVFNLRHQFEYVWITVVNNLQLFSEDTILYVFEYVYWVEGGLHKIIV